MGGRTSKNASTSKHFYFGEVVKKKQYGKSMITVTKPIMGKEEYDEWKQKLDVVHEMNKQALYVPESHQYQKVEGGGLNCCCGVESEIEATYEDVDFIYSSEIENRHRENKFYQEMELTLILYNLARGVKEFEMKGVAFGDLRTKNILITCNKEMKMVNVGSFPWEETAVDKVLNRYDTKTVFFLAPEEVSYIAAKGYGKKFPTPKSQAWSLGLCILEAATLESSQDIYQMPRREVKTYLLNERLRRVEEKYQNLHPFLVTLLKENENERMTCGQCWAMMNPYGQKITQLQRFNRNINAQNDSIRKYRTKGSMH